MAFGEQAPATDAASVPADAYLLDVREVDEWQAGHAPAAVHIPLGELQTRVNEVPQDQDVYVVCRSGGRSGQATKFLNANGWRATNVDGGMQAWATAGRAMETDSGQPPQVA